MDGQQQWNPQQLHEYQTPLENNNNKVLFAAQEIESEVTKHLKICGRFETFTFYFDGGNHGPEYCCTQEIFEIVTNYQMSKDKRMDYDIIELNIFLIA